MSQQQCALRLQQADAFLLPSLFECGGAVVLEAMAMGLPVIAAVQLGAGRWTIGTRHAAFWFRQAPGSHSSRAFPKRSSGLPGRPRFVGSLGKPRLSGPRQGSTGITKSIRFSSYTDWLRTIAPSRVSLEQTGLRSGVFANQKFSSRCVDRVQNIPNELIL